MFYDLILKYSCVAIGIHVMMPQKSEIVENNKKKQVEIESKVVEHNLVLEWQRKVEKEEEEKPAVNSYVYLNSVFSSTNHHRRRRVGLAENNMLSFALCPRP